MLQTTAIKVIYVTLFLITIKTNCISQVKFNIGWGSVTAYTQQSVKLINGKNDLSFSGPQWVFGIEYQRKRISFFGSYSQYDGATTMRISRISKIGFMGSALRRYDIGINYNLLKPHKRFFVKPILAIGLQKSQYRSDLWGEQLNINGPEYYQNKPATSEHSEFTQLVPSLGIQGGIKIAKRIEVGLRMQAVYGFRTYQKITLHYTYKDDPLTDRVAIFDSRGTGIFSSLYLAINLSKLGEDITKNVIKE